MSRPASEQRPNETITIVKTITGDQETIKIATKPEARQEEPDDLLVEANYRNRPDEDEETATRTAELSIQHAKPDRPFETVFVEPDETTTEVIVDADGTKRIIVKKLHRTVVRQQQTVQQHVTTATVATEGQLPITEQTFSEVTLQGQESSTTMAKGDGTQEVATSKSYGGKIVAGVAGGEVAVHEFQSEPELHYSVIEATSKPEEVEVQGVRLHEGDVTFVDDQNMLLPGDGDAHITYEGNEIHTSSSSVRAVVQQVTRRVIRKTRRIIRRIVIVDGKEQVTEEIVEEPEEMELTEESVPRVSINVTRSAEDHHQERYVHTPAQEHLQWAPEQQRIVLTDDTVSQFLESERRAPSSVVVASAVESPSSLLVTEGENAQKDERVASTPSTTVEQSKPFADLSQTGEEPKPGAVLSSSTTALEATLELETAEERPKTPKVVTEETVTSEVARPPSEKPESSPTPAPKTEVVIATPPVVDLESDAAKSCEQREEAKSEGGTPQISLAEEIVEVVKQEALIADVAVESKVDDAVTSPEKSEKPETPEHEVILEMKPTDLEEENASPVLSVVMPDKEVEAAEKNASPSGQQAVADFLDSERQAVRPDALAIPQPPEEVTVSTEASFTKITPQVEITTSLVSGVRLAKSQPPDAVDGGTAVDLQQQQEEPTPAVGIVDVLEASATPVPSPKDPTFTVEESEVQLQVESPKTASPDSVAGEPAAKVEEALPAKLAEPFRSVEFALSVEEKQTDDQEVSPKVSFSMATAVDESQPPEIVLKDINVTLPAAKEVDHGGTRARKKKKKVTPQPSTETSLSLAESTDIELPVDSQGSGAETPRPTEENLELAIAEDGEHSDEEDGEDEESGMGYEADKTTVDESVPEHQEDRGDKKKRRKKKKKQKIKFKDGEESSNVPESVSDSTPIGDSVQFSDEDVLTAKPEAGKGDEPKKAKKRGRKDKKGRADVEESGAEAELESAEQEPALAHSEEIVSPNETYKSLSTQSEPETVKIVEEKIASRPPSESPKELGAKVVTTVPVIEAVFTQEVVAQTSPELGPPPTAAEATEGFIEHEIEREQASVQTSPEPVAETVELSMQTTPDVKEEVVLVKPETQESSSQMDVVTQENVTQTSPSPEKISVITAESAIQTLSPEQPVLLEEFVQTISPEVTEIPRSESAMQTIVVDSREELVQTVSPPELEAVETSEFGQQAVSSDLIPLIEESAQTSPPLSAPFQEQVAQTEVPYPSPPPPAEIAPRRTADTKETTVQTLPVAIGDANDASPPTSGSSDRYDIHVEASLLIPSDSPIPGQDVKGREDRIKIETQPGTFARRSSTEEETVESDEFEVEVTVDGKPVGDRTASSFMNGGGRKRERKEHARTLPPYDRETESMVVSKVFVDVSPERAKKPATGVPDVEASAEESQSPPPPIVVTIDSLEKRVVLPNAGAKHQQESSVADPVGTPHTETLEILIQPESADMLRAIEAFIESERFNQPSAIVDVSITIPRESRVSPETPLTIDVEGKPVQVKQHKTKTKHTSSVTIEEAMSPTETADTPVTPGGDTPLSPPDYTRPVWERTPRIEPAAAAVQDVAVRWNQTQAMERVKNLQNARRTTHLSDVLYLATLNEVVTDESIERRNYSVRRNLDLLQEAVVKKDAAVVHQSVVTTVETITTWLETIEYRIYLNRQRTGDGPSRERVDEFGGLKEEIASIEASVGRLESAVADADDVCNEEERVRLAGYVDSLRKQVKVIEEVTHENEQLAAGDLSRWDEFVNGVEIVTRLVNEVRNQLGELVESDASPQTKLGELEKIDNSNRCHMLKTSRLIATARCLMRDFPGREIPQEVFANHDLTKQIDRGVAAEREKALQLLSLGDEYEQTLKEFGQIIEIAEALVVSPIAVRNLEHLEDEMQNHRKFFANLSHCRAILESLEENLDSETRALHSELHQSLYERARVILDEATGRFRRMSLAATRWTVLEQGTKDEMRWLQVAQQRVPDLSSVTSADYDQYINLYQSLAMDISHHHGKLAHLNDVACKLQELVCCSGLEQIYGESLHIIVRLQEDVQGNLKRLLAFKDAWGSYNLLSDRLEYWLRDAERELERIEAEGATSPPGHMRHFWELKAQHEVNNGVRLQATTMLEKSMQVVPVADEMMQRKFHADTQRQWLEVTERIERIQAGILETISAPDVPINEKLALLERELRELKSVVDGLHGIIKNEEELDLYVERLQIMAARIETIQNELGKLGLLSADESEKVGALLVLSKSLEAHVAEELEGGGLLKERLQAIQRGLARVRRKHGEITQTLDNCESAEKLGSEAVEKAANECYEAGEELVTLWQDLMGLRQLLHTLPMRLRVTVSPVKVEREISQLQDDHTALEKRCGQLLALLRSRLALWQRFERQLEMVQQSVQEADFMMELLTVQGAVDYERLKKATERLESVSGDLVSRESLISELKASAKPLAESCSPEVSARVEAAVQEAVTAWEDTCTNLRELCTKYHHAADLWKQYREASDLVREWVDSHMEGVGNLEPEEAIEAVKVCEETLAEHAARLQELKQLVSGIASAVGLDAGSLLGGEVEALGQRLQDVRQSLTALADVAEARAKAKSELNGTRGYLDSVQKSVNGLQPEDEENGGEEKLRILRDHLLALGKAEGRIEQLKEQALDDDRATRTETSIVEILALWQQVFSETFRQYHRLSSRLVKNEDGAAALKLWQEYLLSVQQFLSGSIPDDYHSLSEHQHLCQVHQNLLATQQNVLRPKSDGEGGHLASGLVEMSVMEQFNTLTNLHNETLARIMERHAEVQDRLDAWDTYRRGQSRLLAWLKDMEKEREKLQLRYVHARRVPKTLARIDGLLKKIPDGERQADKLRDQHDHLVRFCDDALATSIRMEHVAMAQRISNLQAGLLTWRQFLQRISDLLADYEERAEKAQRMFDSVQDVITANAEELPSTHSGIGNRLETLQRTRSHLADITKDLEALGVVQEQLKECLSPGDVKTINQRMWLFWHQQGDLDHQLSVLCHRLEEKSGLRSMFETRQSRFVSWTIDVENRLDKESENTAAAIKDPEEILHKLETELQAEMQLKEREYSWLVATGEELVASCGEEYSDAVARQNIRARTDLVKERWGHLENLGRTRADKIHEMLRTISQLEQRIAEIRAWLAQVEMQLAKPLEFDAPTKEAVDRRLQEHDKLRKSIEKESGNIGEVLNLSELLLSDADVWNAHFNTESITQALKNLEKRWKNVCGLSAERKRRIVFIWKLLQEVLKLGKEHEPWLTEQEKKLKELDSPANRLDRNGLQELVRRVKGEIAEVESRGPAFEILEQTYSKLAKGSGLEPDTLHHLTARARSVIRRWYVLRPNADDTLRRLRRELGVYEEFEGAHEDVVIGLTKADAKLTELQHLRRDSPLLERLNDLEEVETLLAAQNSNLARADGLGLLIMKRGHEPEVKHTQEMIDEYQMLWKDVQERLITLKERLHAEKAKQQEVDEGVQVETLKFEQDTAVQVNTLPPQLQRMTSISAKDAYLLEFKSALKECHDNVNDLESLVELEVPRQGSPDLHVGAKRIAKLTATCQSNVELVKHLHQLLLNDCDVGDEDAKSEEVAALIEKFEDLLTKAKDKEQKIREMSEAGRLLCPLCTKRNWAQLDNDLWRLEQWLQVAEGTQSSQRSAPANIEQLEDVIQDHREFVLDLDSHKSIVRSLNIVGTHLADHTEDVERAERLRERLEADNKRWDSICKNAAAWELLLKRSLMENQQFHGIISELCTWLEKTETKIRASEPVDLTADTDTLVTKYQRFRELRAELERCEPRVLSLQEAAKHLLSGDEVPEGSRSICAKLTDLRLKLHLLIKLTGVYILKLGAVLGRDPNEILTPAVGTSLHTLGYDLLDHTTAAALGTSPDGCTRNGDTDDQEINTTVLRRGYRFLGRVVRASLPIQAFMLLLLGVATLVPNTEDDYACSVINALTNSLNPMLHYPNGPPPR